MTWTEAELITAYQTLQPAPSSLAAAVAALNAQTQTVTVDVPVQSIAGYLGSQNKLVSFLEWASSPPAGASATAVTAVKALALALQNSGSFPTFQMTNPTVAANMETDLAALVNPGSGIAAPITAADQTAILALASQTVPIWQPALTIADLQTAGL